MRKKKLTHTKLKKLLLYNLKSGNLIWRSGRCRKRRAGAVRSDGYLKISIDNQVYTAHKLVWFYEHGSFPKGKLRFIDRNKRNTRIENLEEFFTKLKKFSNNIPGVTYFPLTKEWRVNIKVKNRVLFLGRFKDKTDAVVARKEGEITYGFRLNSPAYKYLQKEIPWMF